MMYLTIRRLTCLITCCTAIFFAPILYAAPWTLFHSHEERSNDLSAFGKWTSALESYQHTKNNEAVCDDSTCPNPQWNALVKQWQERALSLDMLEAVNQHFNQSPYVLDSINWNINDFWAHPLQFLLKNGDCEDYAIAKYMALRDIGVPADAMRVIVLQDHNLNVLHSVLAVQLEDNILILDNQIEDVVADGSIVHYQPIYSINENHWWRHVPSLPSTETFPDTTP